jgi:multicomponent Na+:H+ antiporter subunit E
MFLYFFVFVIELIRANIDVAGRVLQPSLPIKPGIVRIRLLLANSITLTPGTMTVETRGNEFFIHWMAVREDDPEGATRAIAARFERYSEVFLG